MEIGRKAVLKEIDKQLKVLEKTGFAGLIPEVGSNIVFAVENARSFSDVAAVPGRIRNAMGRPVFLRPEFGASTHVASMILGAMKYEPEKRAALNIRYSGEIISALQSMGLKTVFVDRMKEPDDIKDREGASVPWALEKACGQCGGMVPDVIFHRGAVGKEPITIILGENPAKVTGIVLELMKRMI